MSERVALTNLGSGIRQRNSSEEFVRGISLGEFVLLEEFVRARFVSGHRFSDAATLHETVAPSGAAGRTVRLFNSGGNWVEFESWMRRRPLIIRRISHKATHYWIIADVVSNLLKGFGV